MTVLEHLTPESIRAAVRDHPRLGPAVREISVRTGLPEEVVRQHLTESLTASLERLGEVYVGRMGETIHRIDGLREQVHSFYDQVLTGREPNPDVTALATLFRQLHDSARELNDPQTWAERNPDVAAQLTDPVPPPARGGTSAPPRDTATGAPTSDTAPPREPPPPPPDVPVTRAQAVREFVQAAQARSRELAADHARSSRETAAANRRVAEINGQLGREGVDIRWVRDEGYVRRLPERLRQLVEERGERIDEIRAGIAEQRELQRRKGIWDRAATSDVLARRYAELRGRTPDGVAQARASAAVEDILGVRNTRENPTQADHVVPVMEVVAMEGFVLLPDDVALSILNDANNFENLNRSANASKSDWSWEEWPQWREHASPELRAEMMAREAQVRGQLQRRIRTELSRLGISL